MALQLRDRANELEGLMTQRYITGQQMMRLTNEEREAFYVLAIPNRLDQRRFIPAGASKQLAAQMAYDQLIADYKESDRIQQSYMLGIGLDRLAREGVGI